MDDDKGSEYAGPAGSPSSSAIPVRLRQLSESWPPEHRRSWTGDCGPGNRQSRSGSCQRMPGPGDTVSPVRHRPFTRRDNHSLRYSGGSLHVMDQPASFDHNFESLSQDKAKSSSPPTRPLRRHRDGSAPRDRGQSLASISVTHLSRQLPPLVRVQADLDAENLGSSRYKNNLLDQLFFREFCHNPSIKSKTRCKV